LEFLGVERGKNIAEVIVRWRSVVKRQEPAQEFEFPFAEPSNVGDRLSTGEHRQKAKK
jgi:hypothetical protein